MTFDFLRDELERIKHSEKAIDAEITAFCAGWKDIPPEISQRLEPGFLANLLSWIVRTAPPEDKRESKARQRRRAVECPAGVIVWKGKSVPARNHYRAELIQHLMFGDANLHYSYDSPHLLLSEATNLVASWLVDLGLEGPRVDAVYHSSKSRRRDEQIRMISQNLQRHFSEWNPRQLPNFPRGVFSSGGSRDGVRFPGGFSNSKAEIEKSKIKMTHERVRARKRRMAVTKTPDLRT